jgi:uncharacterized protein
VLELLAVAAAGAAAGASNSIAGAGSLITFPTMVALGLPPLSANVTNTVGIVPGYVGGILGYSDLLRQQGERFARFLVPMTIGAVLGTAALLLTSDAAFEAIVPVLIAASCLLLLFQPRLTVRLRHAGNEHSPYLTAGLLFCGAYGAYFGSAVSILLFAILALFVADTLQHLNAMKIILVGCAKPARRRRLCLSRPGRVALRADADGLLAGGRPRRRPLRAAYPGRPAADRDRRDRAGRGGGARRAGVLSGGPGSAEPRCPARFLPAVVGAAAAQQTVLQLEAPADLDGKCLGPAGVEDDAADGGTVTTDIRVPHLDVEVFELFAELGEPEVHAFLAAVHRFAAPDRRGPFDPRVQHLEEAIRVVLPHRLEDLLHNRSICSRRTIHMGGTGLEPVTPSL